jgi:hypothetical protein
MKTYIIHTPENLKHLTGLLLQYQDAWPLDIRVSQHKDKRTVEQNSKMWAMLHDVSEQIVLTPNGYALLDYDSRRQYYEHFTPENWKDIFTASWKKQMAAPGIDGGFVVLGTRTSKMTISEMAEIIELMYAFGAEQGVKWTDEQ